MSGSDHMGAVILVLAAGGAVLAAFTGLGAAHRWAVDGAVLQRLFFEVAALTIAVACVVVGLIVFVKALMEPDDER